MPIPTVADFENAKIDVDDLAEIVNGSTTVTTRYGGDKLSVDQALSQIIVGEVTAYNAGTTYTNIEDWVEFNNVIYRPLPSELPIGPEAFDANKWSIAQGIMPGDDTTLGNVTFDSITCPDLNGVNRIDLGEAGSNGNIRYDGNTDHVIRLASTGSTFIAADPDNSAAIILRPNGVSSTTGQVNVTESAMEVENILSQTITFENSATPANTSLIRASNASGDQTLIIRGKNLSGNGGWVNVYGEDDATYPSQVRIGSEAGEGGAGLIVNTSDVEIPDLTIDDYGGTSRRAGWMPQRVTATSNRAFANADINNTIVPNSGVTLTLNTGLAYDGAMIQIAKGSGTSITIAEGAGVTIQWQQGGSVSTGNRTVAVNSVVTLFRNSSTVWYLWGDGIS